MKTKIVVCCERMDDQRLARFVEHRYDRSQFTLRIGDRTIEIAFCPWCGGKLPFPFEEKDDVVVS